MSTKTRRASGRPWTVVYGARGLLPRWTPNVPSLLNGLGKMAVEIGSYGKEQVVASRFGEVRVTVWRLRWGIIESDRKERCAEVESASGFAASLWGMKLAEVVHPPPIESISSSTEAFGCVDVNATTSRPGLEPSVANASIDGTPSRTLIALLWGRVRPRRAGSNCGGDWHSGDEENVELGGDESSIVEGRAGDTGQGQRRPRAGGPRARAQ
ncbi:hypothetical protein FA13DRAFT_1714406 [Coprinellus micaceus]|uniref:Uncharacterized protein n=1 Tax=Coprinellus micaceus TaxID=71717 RepID=A0A4Y7SSI1_COPMI|nr:hypothetical protein FA13DRAFT_1714406 [Coprinellus micaceus]